MHDLHFLTDKLHQRTNISLTSKMPLAILHHSLPNLPHIMMASPLLHQFVYSADSQPTVLLTINHLLVFSQ